MSPDTIDHLIVSVVEYLEKVQPVDFDDDTEYEQFTAIFYSILEPLCTKDRNYN